MKTSNPNVLIAAIAQAVLDDAFGSIVVDRVIV